MTSNCGLLGSHLILLIISLQSCLLPECDRYFAEHKEQLPPLSALPRGHEHRSVHYPVPDASPHDDGIVLIL